MHSKGFASRKMAFPLRRGKVVSLVTLLALTAAILSVHILMANFRVMLTSDPLLHPMADATASIGEQANAAEPTGEERHPITHRDAKDWQQNEEFYPQPMPKVPPTPPKEATSNAMANRRPNARKMDRNTRRRSEAMLTSLRRTPAVFSRFR